MPGLIGKKIGMTRIFDDAGVQIPVTIIEAGPCAVVQVKSEESDGYSAIQLGFGAQKAKRASKAEGRGFQGVVKRHGFKGRPASHGHSMSRTPGSMGPGTDPSRVIKGKKLPGRMGGTRTTIRNLQVVRVDGERNLIFVKGGVPGARNGYVLISK